jgi:hypothetical protein
VDSDWKLELFHFKSQQIAITENLFLGSFDLALALESEILQGKIVLGTQVYWGPMSHRSL